MWLWFVPRVYLTPYFIYNVCKVPSYSVRSCCVYLANKELFLNRVEWFYFIKRAVCVGNTFTFEWRLRPILIFLIWFYGFFSFQRSHHFNSCILPPIWGEAKKSSFSRINVILTNVVWRRSGKEKDKWSPLHLLVQHTT